MTYSFQMFIDILSNTTVQRKRSALHIAFDKKKGNLQRHLDGLVSGGFLITDGTTYRCSSSGRYAVDEYARLLEEPMDGYELAVLRELHGNNYRAPINDETRLRGRLQLADRGLVNGGQLTAQGKILATEAGYLLGLAELSLSG